MWHLAVEGYCYWLGHVFDNMHSCIRVLLAIDVQIYAVIHSDYCTGKIYSNAHCWIAGPWFANINHVSVGIQYLWLHMFTLYSKSNIMLTGNYFIHTSTAPIKTITFKGNTNIRSNTWLYMVPRYVIFFKYETVTFGFCRIA